MYNERLMRAEHAPLVTSYNYVDDLLCFLLKALEAVAATNRCVVVVLCIDTVQTYC
jgi:hypothetical protein